MFCNQCGMDTGNEAPFCVKCGGRSIETVSMPSAGIGAATAPARSPAPQLLAKGPEPDLAVWVLLPIVFLAGWCTVAGIRQLQRRPATSQVEQIANTPVTLNPDGYYYYKFKVPLGARHAIVEGHFSTAGGPGNEIEAYILRKDDFEGWWNGEHRPTIYQSGKCMQSTIKARLPAGDVYYLVLSNQVSKASSKVVLIDVTLTYNL
jgi:hypothetical protein